MQLHISVSGGNHVLRRSVLEACERAGHHGTIVDTSDDPPDSRARVDPAGQPDPMDVSIVLDPSLVPGATAGPGLDERAASLRRDARNGRVVFAYSRGGDAEHPQSFPSGHVTVVRTAPVYGIAADAITLLLIMMRSLPAVPLLREPRRIQPVWHEDFATALVAAAERSTSRPGLVYEIAGPDAVTLEQLFERLAELTDRRPLRIPIPEFVAEHGAGLASRLGLSQSAEAILDSVSGEELPREKNVLASELGVTPTRLDDGLRRLIAQLDEVTPAEGVGSVQVKRFRADIRGSALGAADLIVKFRERFGDIMPIGVGVEPVAPARRLDEGSVITMALPGRGHVQVRVREVTPDHVVVATLRGHAVAGTVRFGAAASDGAVRFEVTTCDAPANALDWLALSLGGARVQDANWTRVVQKVVELSGGTSDGVESEIRTLTPAEAEEAERAIRALIDRDGPASAW